MVVRDHIAILVPDESRAGPLGNPQNIGAERITLHRETGDVHHGRRGPLEQGNRRLFVLRKISAGNNGPILRFRIVQAGIQSGTSQPAIAPEHGREDDQQNDQQPVDSGRHRRRRPQGAIVARHGLNSTRLIVQRPRVMTCNYRRSYDNSATCEFRSPIASWKRVFKSAGSFRNSRRNWGFIPFTKRSMELVNRRTYCSVVGGSTGPEMTSRPASRGGGVIVPDRNGV